MQGLQASDVRPMVAGVSPRLDVFINGSTEVNIGRAQLSACVALPAPHGRREHRARPTDPRVLRDDDRAEEPGAGADHPVRRLSPAEVRKLERTLPDDPDPPDVEFSLFVQIAQDLDPQVRRSTIAEIDRVITRARWKRDTATIEIAGRQIRALLTTPGVTYVEPGQTLQAPQPIVDEALAAPDVDGRRITAEARRHRYGRQVLVGIIDVGGFDFAHPDFAEPRGRGTRWVAIWDQGGTVRRPPAENHPRQQRFESFTYGSEIRQHDMDSAIAAAAPRNMSATSLEPQSQMVAGSHGTHVASIAAGASGVARRATLAGVLVALPDGERDAATNFYDSTRIADAVDYLLGLAAELGDGDPLPVSINISLGTNGHAHDTSSFMARWIDNALTTPGRCVAVAAGNAGQVEPTSSSDVGFVTGRVHAAGRFSATNLRHELGWIVVGGEIADISENEMEIWYSPQDRIDVEVKPPGGSWLGPIRPGANVRSKVLDDGTVLSVHSETYHPANGANRIAILLSPFFGPIRDGVRAVGPIAAGEWKVRLTGTTVRDGRYDAWIERDDRRPLGTPRSRTWSYPSYFAPGSYTNDRMVNSLACAERVVSVGNVDLTGNAAHVTSSRGPTRDGRYKPDIGADGTDVVAACGFDRRRRWVRMTGTSMASPYVCGVAALMLAIEPRLTSAQVVGIMRTRSVPLAGHEFAWRNDTGFGVIDAAECVRETVVVRDARQAARL